MIAAPSQPIDRAEVVIGVIQAEPDDAVTLEECPADGLDRQ
jgi:hypothetical protein